MENNQELPHIPSFPFDAGSTSLIDLLSNFVALMRFKVKLWENAKFVLIDLPLNREAAKKLLPLGMRLTDPARATFFIADYTKTAFTIPYRECALLLHVHNLIGGIGVHCPWMIVDDDTAMIYGRELLGYPKKMGTFRFDEKDGRISAGLTRRGVEVLSVEALKQTDEKNPGPVLGIKTFNFGGLGQMSAFSPLVLFKPGETIHESYTAEAELRIEDSPYDPIKGLIADYRNPMPARISRIDIYGSRYMLPVGLSGAGVYAHTFKFRFR